jgi:hypothetical protein
MKKTEKDLILNQVYDALNFALFALDRQPDLIHRAGGRIGPFTPGERAMLHRAKKAYEQYKNKGE